MLGDSNVKIAQSPSFNVLKNSTWADVKVKANQKISFSDGFILKSWHLTNKDGKLLVDTEMFTENTTVFAVSQTDIPQQDEIVITVSGDTNVKIAQSPSFNVLKNSTWASVKVKADQKISFSDGFVLKSWHLTNKDGKLLLDTEVFTENTTVFAVSEKENIPEESEKPVKDEDGNEIKEEIIGEKGKDKEVKATIEVVEVKEEGKEKPTTKLKISGNILSDETKRIADILRSKIYEYKNKKDELKSIQFDALTNNSTLNIQFKDESKKINVEDLKILVAKIPNQVKIDNEETITLDKTANITSIKGTVSLMDIVKGANSNSELTKWEFISDKIKEQSSINSDNLAITSKECEKFNTENLKKVANVLSKTEITNTTTNGNQAITLGKDAKISSINGNIALKDIVDAKNETDTELANYIAYNLKNTPSIESPSGILKINTFYKKPSTIQGSSLSLRGNNNEEPKSTPITPSVLSDIKNSALNNASLNFKDGDKNITVTFQSSKTDFFNITDFSTEIKTGKLQNIVNEKASIGGKIFLLSKEGLKTKNGKPTYSNIDDLLNLINNERLRKHITVGNTYIVGKNVKDLLPHLVGPNKITEEDGGIKFLNEVEFGCDENLTQYKGDNINPLPVEQLIEFRKRTDELTSNALGVKHRALDITNLILENVDTTRIDEAELEFLNFKNDNIGGNIVFRGGNLSRIKMIGVKGGSVNNVIFEKTTLPYDMEKCYFSNLKLQDVTFPEKEMVKFARSTPAGITCLNAMLPQIEGREGEKGKLEISGYIKDFPEKELSTTELEELKDDGKTETMPSIYKGPKDIYEKLRTYIYSNNPKAEKPIFTTNNSLTSLNKKPQSPFLLALLQGKADHTRG